MDFDVSSQEHRSLLLVSQIKDKTLSPTEVFALEKAGKFRATAVYFRYFPDDRPPLPQIYLYDNTEEVFSKDDLAIIHRDLWSNSHIPVFIVIEKTDVKIFDTREPVEVLGEKGEIIKNRIFDTVKFSADTIKQYSKKMFDSGVFWETEKAKDHFLESKSAYQDLINELKKIRIKFTEKLEKNAAKELKAFNKLLVFSILIKYLEERGELFAEDFFRKIGSKNYCDALRRGKVFTLFGELSRHFNGKIFEWTEEEKKIINSNADLNQLAEFLDANIDTDTGQGFFWRRYSFNHLPVELISTVYETFLSENEDAVFTPEFLVNTLLDEAMPQKEYKKTVFKTIDVSCGSGIFLVGAFKRLAERHRYSKFQETGELLPAQPDDLLKIIKENIFGVDIEDESIRLTVFSLCLALFDELNPKQIWTELKFDDTFQTNFQTQNFFEYLEDKHTNLGTWDLVIGNAPFNGLTIKKDENGNYFGKFSGKQSKKSDNRKKIKFNKEITSKINRQIYPDNQIALMFLDQAPRLLKENGLVCLILPSAPLLYNNSSEFRKEFFPKYQVLRVLDFTNLDSILFGKANVPTAALFVSKQSHNTEKPIVHVTIRRTKTVEEKIFFEVDKYDFHLVSQQDAVKNKHVWKCNLLGGGRLNNLITRLSNNRTIENFVEEQNWEIGEGYIDSKTANEVEYLSNKFLLHADGLTETGIDRQYIQKQGIVRPHRVTNKHIFEPPHILIKENIGEKRIPIDFSDEYLTFRNTIIGISASQSENKLELSDFYKNFKRFNDIFRLFISATSNKYLVKRATLIQKQDIVNLPYPKDEKELSLSFAEQILCDDVLNYYSEIKAKSSKAKLNEQAEKDDLEVFGKVFTKSLNSIYEQSSKCFYLKKIYNSGIYYISEFNYGTKNGEVEVEENSQNPDDFKSLIETKYGESVYLIKIIKIYERNKIFLIKPKSLRFWLRSIALRDADEVFSDLIKAGY